MKSNTIALSKWHTAETDGVNLDVDWPRYHQEVGEDCIQWLMDHERKGQCQLIIERQHSRLRLTCEFFSDKLLTEYILLWKSSYDHTLNS